MARRRAGMTECHIRMFLSKLRSDLWAVPLLIPVSDVIWRQERPCARKAAILPQSTTTRGRPRYLLVRLLLAVPQAGLAGLTPCEFEERVLAFAELRKNW